MSFALDVPEDLAGGSGDFMDKPGKYHFIVTDIREEKDRKDEYLDGFSIEIEARAGTDETQIGKKLDLNLINGQETHKDGGEMCRRKQAAFLIAANLVSPSDLGKKGVQIDLDKARGAQICAEMALGKPSATTGNRYLDVKGASYWHVDDPRAAEVPKAKDELSLIPEPYRHKPEFFAPLQPAKKQAAATARVTQDDFAGL